MNKRMSGTPDMIIAGNGSDDILTIATRAFLNHGETLAAPDPSYSLYPVLAQLQDARFVAVPWDKDYSLPIDGLLARLVPNGVLADVKNQYDAEALRARGIDVWRL